MAFFDSEKSVFDIADNASTVRDISAYIEDLSGLPGPRGLNDVTGLGDGGRKWSPGLEDVSISLAGTYDDTASTGPDAVMGPLRTATVKKAFRYGPKGSSSSFVKYSGDCWVEDYQTPARVGSKVAWTATLRVDGKVARGTF